MDSATPRGIQRTHGMSRHYCWTNDADIEATDGTKWTALIRAATVRKCGNSAAPALQVCQLEGQRNGRLFAAPSCRRILAITQIVKILVDQGSELEARDNQLWTPLHHAAWNGHEKTTRSLLKEGANISARADDGWTALHQATWKSHDTVVRRLLQAGADPNETDDQGETALHQAAWRGHDAVVKILLDKDANPNSRDRAGQAPLHQAAGNGSKAVVQMLLDEGADPRAQDGESRKPHSLAEENFHHSTAKILRDKETELYGEEVLPDTENIPKTSPPGTHVDSAIVAALSADPTSISIEPYGQAGFSTPSKILVSVDNSTSTYFMKTGPDEEMFKGEYELLNAIHTAVPSLCPKPITHGKLAESSDYFLLTEFIDMEATAGGQASGLSLAQKLATLHSSTPAIPRGFSKPAFGFHVMTCVGRTRQNNTWNRSWPKFFAENRLREVWKTVETNHGMDTELQALLDRVVKEVVPRLLGNGHLGGRRGVLPALVHGDLWSGNKARGRIGGKGGVEEVTFDSSSCYAHSEYELGIMRMFGGFSAGFFNEYHRLIPKTYPKSEYDDRLSLYELYQWLNHYALFSGGYREDALECMEKLVEKYGKEDENDDDDDDSDLS